jgi:hypothetical protein
MVEIMRNRGGSWGIGLAVAFALGACSSQMDPNAPQMPPSTTTTTMGDSLSDLGSVAGSMRMIVLAANGGTLMGANDLQLHFYKQDPGTIAAAAFAAHIPLCPVELDNLPMPPLANDDEVVNSLQAELQKCDLAVSPTARMTLSALQTPSTVVIVGANAAEIWHTTNNGVNYFYGDEILFMLHAARELNVTACVVAPADIALPMAPSGQTPGVSIADALAGCGLPP